MDVKEHNLLIRIFTEHTLRKTKVSWNRSREMEGRQGARVAQTDPGRWGGELPAEALLILHQHAVQGDITAVQEAACYWLAYSAIHLHLGLDFRLLHRVLADLLSAWLPTTLDKEEEGFLADSFAAFLAHSHELVAKHRERLPASLHASAHRLEDLLRCLTLLHSSDLFKRCLPFERALTSQLQSLIKVTLPLLPSSFPHSRPPLQKSAISYYERAKYAQEKHQPQSEDGERELTRLSQLATIINAACYQGKKLYQRVFKT